MSATGGTKVLVPSTMVVTPAAMAWAAACPVMSWVPGVTSRASAASSSVASPVATWRWVPMRLSRYTAARESGKQMAKYSTAAAT